MKRERTEIAMSRNRPKVERISTTPSRVKPCMERETSLKRPRPTRIPVRDHREGSMTIREKRKKETQWEIEKLVK